MSACIEQARTGDRSNPMTATVAKLIIELAKNGERDPKKLCDEDALACERERVGAMNPVPPPSSSLASLPGGAFSCTGAPQL
jgi:hypothetical protein